MTYFQIFSALAGFALMTTARKYTSRTNKLSGKL